MEIGTGTYTHTDTLVSLRAYAHWGLVLLWSTWKGFIDAFNVTFCPLSGKKRLSAEVFPSLLLFSEPSHFLVKLCWLVETSGREFGSSLHRVIPFTEERRCAFALFFFFPHSGFPGLFSLGSSCSLSLHSRFLASCLWGIVENSKTHFQTWRPLVCASVPQCMCSSVCLCMQTPVLCTVTQHLMWSDRPKS